MSDIAATKSSQRARTSVGQLASQRREQLAQLKQAEVERKEAFRREREKLAREVAELDVQARRVARLNELRQKQRVCFVLGELMLDAICSQGLSHLRIDRSTLDPLTPELMELVEAVAYRKNELAKGMKKRSAIESARAFMPLDLEL
jgi:hypothetical protein